MFLQNVLLINRAIPGVHIFLKGLGIFPSPVIIQAYAFSNCNITFLPHSRSGLGNHKQIKLLVIPFPPHGRNRSRTTVYDWRLPLSFRKDNNHDNLIFVATPPWSWARKYQSKERKWRKKSKTTENVRCYFLLNSIAEAD